MYFLLCCVFFGIFFSGKKRLKSGMGGAGERWRVDINLQSLDQVLAT